jgi:hypothetical protein
MSAEFMRKLLNESFWTGNTKSTSTFDQVRQALSDQLDKPVKFTIDVPNHRSNNNARRVAADLLEYNPENDTVTLQVGREDQTKWKFIYLLTYKLEDAHVFDSDRYLSVVYSMDDSKPVYYKKTENPNVKINNPMGRKPEQPRPDPYASK